MFVSREWWKLSWVWLSNPRSRTPPARKSLFQTSLKVAALGLALGVGALSVTLAIVSGFQRTWSSGVAQALGHVGVSTGWRSLEELQKIRDLAPPGVERAEIYWSSQGLLVGEKGGRGVLIEGRAPLEAFHDQAATEEAPVVTARLGRPLLEYLGAQVGGQVRVLLPGILKTPINVQVAEGVSNGMYEIDSRFAVIDAAALRRVLQLREPRTFNGRPGDALGLRLYLDPKQIDALNLSKLDPWIADFDRRLQGADQNGLIVRSWQQQRKNLFGAVDLDRNLLTIVLSLLTLVAAFNVAASLVILFLERDREMATLRALGLSRGQFVVWTGIQGVLLGIVASAGGLVMGRVFGWILTALPVSKLPADIYNIDRLPLAFVGREQLMVFGFGVLASWTVALLLGLRLSKLDFLEILGHRR